MKKIISYIVLISCFSAGCGNKNPNKEYTAAQPAVSADAAVIRFEKDSYDFGSIRQGDTVAYTYVFKNTGKSPLIITDAQSSCGCTIPEYPKEPIAPGKEGALKVVFNSAGKEGKIEKTVTIKSNSAKPYTYVYLTGQVDTPAEKK
jgi:hypothetical protein